MANWETRERDLKLCPEARARQELLLSLSLAIEKRSETQLRSRERQILRLLLEHPMGLTFRSLATKAGLRSTASIHRYVSRLASLGLVETAKGIGTRVPTPVLDFAIRVLEDPLWST